jgi:outer membrane protein OmpA-like peptidoglycan-associated protein
MSGREISITLFKGKRRQVKTALQFKRFCIGSVVLMTIMGGAGYAATAYREPLTVNRVGQRGLLQLYSAHTLGAGSVALGFYTDGTLDQKFLDSNSVWNSFDSSFYPHDDPNPAISSFNFSPFIGAGIADFFDVSVMLPVAIDMIGKYQEVATGDLQITLKFGTHGSSHTPLFDLGFLGAFTLPTGSKETGAFPRHTYYFNKDSLSAGSPRAIVGAYYSSQNVDIEPHLLMVLDLGALKKSVPLALFLDGGMHITTNLTSDKAMLMNAALEYRPAKSFSVVAEFNSEMRLYNFTHGFKMNQDPLHFTPSVVITPSSGLMLTLGSAISLASSSRKFVYVKQRGQDQQLIATGIEPKWRVFAQVGWNGVLVDRDRDRDGIVDRYDQCPDVPEDVDGFMDDDGCPDLDNDKDGIPDSLDKCPNKPEDKDGYQDQDGCPDEDNDNDRIADSVDKCVNVPEDFDGFEDKDGCPDVDNDRDGVPDSVDRCPNIPEDIDGFQDNDGCPDVDNDQDGVPDSLDKCPNQVGVPENGGCPAVESPKAKPRAKEIKRGRVILRGVTFEQGTATLDPSSFPMLDEVVASLVDWPLAQIEIQGYTDTKQGSTLQKLQLSQDRAESVRNYLSNRGISPVRLSAVGKSDGNPIGDNATKAGRAVNNRIELRRTDPQ